MVAIVWGHHWSGKLIQFNCYNEAVVLTLNSLSCKDKGLPSLLRCMIFIGAKYSFWFSSVHILGHLNIIADAISHNQMKMFYSQAPSAIEPFPINIPHTLPEVLYRDPPDWHSPAWTHQFKNFMQPTLQKLRTEQDRKCMPSFARTIRFLKFYLLLKNCYVILFHICVKRGWPIAQ